MPPRDWPLRLEDILEATSRIQAYTSGMDREAFFSDTKTLDAVIRNFIVIGEAARYLPEEVINRYPEVPWAEMGAMRNFVIHQYPEIEPQIVWDTITRNLPPLVPLLERILAETGGEAPQA